MENNPQVEDFAADEQVLDKMADADKEFQQMEKIIKDSQTANPMESFDLEDEDLQTDINDIRCDSFDDCLDW